MTETEVGSVVEAYHMGWMDAKNGLEPRRVKLRDEADIVAKSRKAAECALELLVRYRAMSVAFTIMLFVATVEAVAIMALVAGCI